MTKPVKVAKIQDFRPGESKTVSAEGVQVALFNVDGEFHAIENSCLHMGGPLGEGKLTAETVRCPWHGWVYDVTTGENVLDRSLKVRKFKVKVESGWVILEL